MTTLRLAFERKTPGVVDQLIATLTGSEISDILKPVGEAIVESVLQSFVQERDPWGVPWEPLSGVTVALRMRKLGIKLFKTNRRGRRTGLTARATRSLPGQSSGFRILFNVGSLRNSITSRVDGRRVRGSAGGPAAKYARKQQDGDPDNKIFGKYRAPIPSRKYLPIRGGRVDLPAELRAEVVEMVRAGIFRAIRGTAANTRSRVRANG